MRRNSEKFWIFLDRIIVGCIFTGLGFIAAGVFLAFNYEMTVYPFFAGVELVILGFFDLLTTIFWIIWDHTPEQLTL